MDNIVRLPTYKLNNLDDPKNLDEALTNIISRINNLILNPKEINANFYFPSTEFDVQKLNDIKRWLHRFKRIL